MRSSGATDGASTFLRRLSFTRLKRITAVASEPILPHAKSILSESTPLTGAGEERQNVEALWDARYQEPKPGQTSNLVQLQQLLGNVETRAATMNVLSHLNCIKVLRDDLKHSTSERVKSSPESTSHTKASSDVPTLKLNLSALNLGKADANDANQVDVKEEAFKAIGLLAALVVGPGSHGSIDPSWHETLNDMFSFFKSVARAKENVSTGRFGELGKEGALLLTMLAPNANPSYQVDFSAQLLGHGRFGRVFAMGDSLAVKTISIDCSKDSSGHRIARAFQELYVWTRLTEKQAEKSVRYCVPLLHCFSRYLDDAGSQSDICFVMEKATQTLRKWRDNAVLKVEGNEQAMHSFVIDCLMRLAQAAQALDFVSQEHVVHYDIRCDNILLSENSCLLADFGEAICNTGSFSHENRGSECYKSPEMLRVCTSEEAVAKFGDQDDFDRRKVHLWGTAATSDVWSFGCLAFEALTGEHLYQEALECWPTFLTRLCPSAGQPEPDIVPSGKKQALEKLLGRDIADKICSQVLAHILVRDPTRRPTALQVWHRLNLVVSQLQGEERCL